MKKKFISSIDSHYFFGGLIAFYIFSLFFIFDINIEILRNSELSEVASFITGAFTPITFLLLIYQYSSQQKEINRMIQKQEFDEKRNKIAIQPNIEFKDFIVKKTVSFVEGDDYITVSFSIKNSGRKITNVCCQLGSENSLSEQKLITPALIDDKVGHVSFIINKEKPPKNLIFIFIYYDEMKYFRTTTLNLNMDDESFDSIYSSNGYEEFYKYESYEIKNSLENSFYDY